MHDTDLRWGLRAGITGVLRRVGLALVLALGLPALPRVASVELADCDLLIRIAHHPGEARGTTCVGTARWVVAFATGIDPATAVCTTIRALRQPDGDDTTRQEQPPPDAVAIERDQRRLRARDVLFQLPMRARPGADDHRRQRRATSLSSMRSRRPMSATT